MEISGNQTKTITLEGGSPAKAAVVETEAVRGNTTYTPDGGAAVVQENGQNKDDAQKSGREIACSC